MKETKGIFRWTFILLILTAGFNTLAQKNDIEFLVTSIKDNYAGYKDKITDSVYEEVVKECIDRNNGDTFKVLSSITDYFKDPHLKIYEFFKIPQDSVFFRNQLKKINSYFSDIKIKKKKYEGYWINDDKNCIIALKETRSKGLKYNAYVIESNKLPPGIINAQFELCAKDKYLTYYITTGGSYRVSLYSEFRSDSVFTIGWASKWRRLKNYKPHILGLSNQLDFTAKAGRLDRDNYLITIPSNSEENTRILDSIIKAEYEIIGSTKNLIIDIRDNLGGTVRTYMPLFPFVYTNEIQNVSGYKYYTYAMLKTLKEDLNEYKKQNASDTARVRKKEEYIREVNSKIGKILFDTGNVVKFDSIKKFPQNVAIITNYACLSAAEMMILDFRQSKKVTLFGEHTYGGIDYLDDFDLELPSKNYLLSIASYKREIPKGGKKLDNIGIYPDITIPSKNNDWIQFVIEYYNKK